MLAVGRGGLFAAALLALTVACQSSGEIPVIQAPAAEEPTLVGGGPRQQALLREIATRTPVPAGVEFRYLRPEAGDEVSNADAPAALIATITADGPREATQAAWAAALAVGAFNDTIRRQLAPVEYGVRYEVGEDRGSGGNFPIGRRSPFPTSGMIDDRQLREQLAANAADADLALIGITRFNPLRIAALVTLRADDPDEFFRDEGEKIALLHRGLLEPDTPVLDGLYLEIEDRDGNLVRATGYAVRLAAGYGWIAPSYRDA